MCWKPHCNRRLDADHRVLFQERLERLEDGAATEEDWQAFMLAMGSEIWRSSIKTQLLGLDPFPGKKVVALLDHAQLAVRLGALELLEEAAGDDYWYDAWKTAAGEDNQEALERWKQWSGSPDAGQDRFSALTQEQIEVYLLDLISKNRSRAIRAMRKLEQGGAGAVKALRAFRLKNTELPDSGRRRIREVLYYPGASRQPASGQLRLGAPFGLW